MIDLHSHILPGLDDGARDLQESLEIARSMVADGVRIVAATPHVRADYPTSPDAMRDALALVRAAVEEEGIDIDVRGGGEIGLDRLRHLTAAEIGAFGLGGNPRLVLLEFPYYGHAPTLAHDCAALRARGFTPVVAHPERNTTVQTRPADLEEVVAAGGIIQITGASIDGRLGRAAERTARHLLERELAHLVASDAHAPGVREAGLSAAAEAVGGGELAHWLTALVPAALLTGEPLPRRPAAPSKGWRRFAL